MRILQNTILLALALARSTRAECPLAAELEDCPKKYTLTDSCICVKSESDVSADDLADTCTEERSGVKNFRPRTNDEDIFEALGLGKKDLLITNAAKKGGVWQFLTGSIVPKDIQDDGQDCLYWNQSKERYETTDCDDSSYIAICMVRPELKLSKCNVKGGTCPGKPKKEKKQDGKDNASQGGALDAASCAKFCARESAAADEPADYAFYSFDGKTCGCYDECDDMEVDKKCKDCAAGPVACVEKTKKEEKEETKEEKKKGKEETKEEKKEEKEEKKKGKEETKEEKKGKEEKPTKKEEKAAKKEEKPSKKEEKAAKKEEKPSKKEEKAAKKEKPTKKEEKAAKKEKPAKKEKKAKETKEGKTDKKAKKEKKEKKPKKEKKEKKPKKSKKKKSIA